MIREPVISAFSKVGTRWSKPHWQSKRAAGFSSRSPSTDRSETSAACRASRCRRTKTRKPSQKTKTPLNKVVCCREKEEGTAGRRQHRAYARKQDTSENGFIADAVKNHPQPKRNQDHR